MSKTWKSFWMREIHPVFFSFFSFLFSIWTKDSLIISNWRPTQRHHFASLHTVATAVQSKKSPFPFHSNEMATHKKKKKTKKKKQQQKCCFRQLEEEIPWNSDCCACYSLALCRFVKQIFQMFFFGTHWMWLSERVYIKIMSQTQHAHSLRSRFGCRVTEYAANCEFHDHERKANNAHP